MLELTDVCKTFGGLNAVRNVNLTIHEGEIIGLIGPNGAGKTTLFNLVTGIYHPSSGMIRFKGQDITKLSSYKTCELGIGRTFQVVQPFLKMTALENVMVGSIFGKKDTRPLKEAQEYALNCLDFVGLTEKKDHLAKNLTLHDRKFLETARALATEPKLILLDEIASGLNPTEMNEAMNLIKRIKDEREITIFWIEHVMDAVMNIAERVVVLHHGEKIADGVPTEIAKDEKVIDAYLGEKYL